MLSLIKSFACALQAVSLGSCNGLPRSGCAWKLLLLAAWGGGLVVAAWLARSLESHPDNYR